MTHFLIHRETANAHPEFIRDLEASGSEIELYDDLDYIRWPEEERAALDAIHERDDDTDGRRPTAEARSETGKPVGLLAPLPDGGTPWRACGMGAVQQAPDPREAGHHSNRRRCRDETNQATTHTRGARAAPRRATRARQSLDRAAPLKRRVARLPPRRRTFHNYSASHCMLIALQCHQRGMVPEHIAAYHAWIKLGRAVRKDEQAIRILAPITVKQRDNLSHDAEERRVFFKTTFVFDT
jgi:hypothetical protein